MSQDSESQTLVGRAEDAALAALRAVSVLVPSLAELVPVVRVSADPRVETAGIFRSGRMVVAPSWFLSLRPADAAFVVAHELLHLALRTHERASGLDPFVANVAHDYIINDMLAGTLGRAVPAGGLSMPGARLRSLEELSAEIAPGLGRRLHAWSPPATPKTLGDALRRSGLGASSPAQERRLDAFDDALERELFPGDRPEERDRMQERIRQVSLRAASLDLLRRGIESAFVGRGVDPGGDVALVEALHTAYRPPWHEALQTWMEAVAPGERTWARASRRGGDRADVALPGRRREGWTLHIVMDTSGSMVRELPRIAGALREFCEAVNVASIHLLQCDVEVTRDEMIDVESLGHLTVAGLGGSDLSPAMRHLAGDPEVMAAIVLTDGYTGYPEEPMPYAVLWVVTATGFSPPYGKVIPLLG